METTIAIIAGLLIVCLALSVLTGRDEAKHKSRAAHYAELNQKDTAARKKLDAAAARERRNDPDAPENMFKAAATQARQQATLERQAYQLIRAEQRRATAEAKRQEATEKRRAAADKRRAKAAEARAKERERAKREQERAARTPKVTSSKRNRQG